MVLAIVGCGDDPPVVVVPPSINTTDIQTLTFTTALAGGNVVADGGGNVTERGAVWAITTSPMLPSTSKTSDGSGVGTFSSTVTGLSPGTKYFLRAYATNSAGTAYGQEISFTTPANLPTLTTTAASGVAATTAISGGVISADGGSPITARGIVWSVSEHPNILLSTKTTDGTGLGTFTSNAAGLAPFTKYYVSAYATNGAGTAYGQEVTFTTAANFPLVLTNTASSVTANSAISGGAIMSDGGSPVTAKGIVWSISEHPTVSLPTKTVDGAGIGNFISSASGLAPSTKYYVRAYGTNSIGTGYGGEISFTTAPPEPTKVFFYIVVATPTDSESITLKNNSGADADISGWTMGDLNNSSAYTVPAGRIILQGQTMTFPRTTLGFAINDSGETLYLRNGSGQDVDTWHN